MGAATLLLRPRVELELDETHLRIAFALWEARVPVGVLDRAPEFRDLVVQRCLAAHPSDPAGAALVALLEAEGCFLPRARPVIPLRDVPALFLPLRSQLYAEYYAHPFWGRLRSGAASTAEFAAWAVHNYHVSRSAGPIAARRAARAADAAGSSQRAFFRQDSLEEFWHCDAFYFVADPRVTLDAKAVKAYVPLPASTAFEELALNTASEDWLGHLLIAHYQESSILFRPESERFYDELESRYGLPGFFRGWRRHMRLDVEEGHADGLRGLFDSDQPISAKQLLRAVQRVRLAHHYLLSALDQIGSSRGTAEQAIAARQPGMLAATAPLRDDTGGTLDPDPLLAALLDASFCWLAAARRHDDIIAAGQLAQLSDRLTSGRPAVPSDADPDPWVFALRDFLLERATDGRLLLMLADLLLGALAARSPAPSGLLDHQSQVRQLRTGAEERASATDVAQFRELIALAESGQMLAPLPVFAPEPAAGPAVR